MGLEIIPGNTLFLCLLVEIAKALKYTCLCVRAGGQTHTYSCAVRA